MSTVLLRILGRPAKDLSYESSDILKMFCRHSGKERSEKRVGWNFLIKPRDEGFESFSAAHPFIKCGDRVRHRKNFIVPAKSFAIASGHPLLNSSQPAGAPMRSSGLFRIAPAI